VLHGVVPRRTTIRSIRRCSRQPASSSASSRLLDNLAGANLAVTIRGSLTVGIAQDAAGVVAVTLGLGQRVQLTTAT
jgi:hypothetical protein